MGAEAAAAGGVEVSPLASYAGEGLEGLVAGKEVGLLLLAPGEHTAA